MAARFLSESKIRSGSDPNLILKVGGENRRPLVASLISGVKGKSGAKTRTPDSSPKIGRRNPLRMLSNAIDFRHRKRNKRPRSAEFNGVNGNPNGDFPNNGDDSLSPAYLVIPPQASNSRLIIQSQDFSRHSLPNLDPLDVEDSASKSTFSYAANYATNPRNKNRLIQKNHNNNNVNKSSLPPNLENRKSAPDIVVTGTLNEQITQPPSRRIQSGLEEKINRAKQKVQNGLYSLSGSTSSQSLTTTGSVKPKLSSRFHSAQKLNNKILTNFANATNVKRSRTFNISDVQEELAAIGYSRTLPSKQKLKKHHSKGSVISTDGISGSIGSFYTTSSASASFDDSSGSTASSRKSSNSSNESGSISTRTSVNSRSEISQEALEEIAAWERFAHDFYTKQKIKNSNNGQQRVANKEIVPRARPRKLSPVEMNQELIV